MVAEAGAIAASLAAVALGGLVASGAAGDSHAGLPHAAWVQGVGWLGNALFSSRVLIQWIASERARRPVAPRIFWQLSTVGAVVMGAYCVMRGEVVLVPGYVITFLIYLRNMWIARQGEEARGAAPAYLVVVGLGIAIVPYAFGLLGAHGREAAGLPWLVVAIVGQTLWIGRFLVQWRHAERHGKSEFPEAFWWLTIVGGSLNTLYSLHRFDLPLIFGFVTSWIVPARNLMLHRRQRRAAS